MQQQQMQYPNRPSLHTSSLPFIISPLHHLSPPSSLSSNHLAASKQPNNSTQAPHLLRRQHSLPRPLIPPNPITIHSSIMSSRLISPQLIEPRFDDFGRVDENVTFLRMKPGLRILISVADYCYLTVDGEEFDLHRRLVYE